MAVVEFNDFGYRYPTQPEDEVALRNIDLAIDEGAFVGISGLSDAGKSTFTRTIPGYIPHFFDGDFAGSVRVNGITVADASIGELSEQVGLLFEDPFDQLTGSSLTVFEEVAFGLENLGVPKDELVDRVFDSLERVSIAELYKRNPQQLSGGQSQRVALASVLALQPDILVLDEPTSQLDPDGTEEVFDVIEEMATAEEFTVIIVSQDMGRLAPRLDRLLVMDDGEIIDDGSPRAVFKNEIQRDTRRIYLPESTKLGLELRNRGHISQEKLLPLDKETAAEELQSALSADNQREVTPPEPVAEQVSPEEARIRLDDVGYVYEGGVRALEDLSLALESGCICIIGQNGAGKTTFLKHLNGLLEPTEGDVVVNGVSSREASVAALARSVGLSFQNPDDQLFHSSVREEVEYGPKNLGYSTERVDTLATKTLQLLGLESIAEKNPYNLGLPRRKQVAIGSVVAMDTPVIALDEPTGGQDVYGTQLLGNVVEKLVEEDRLVIIITHDIWFASEHADYIITLGDGKRLSEGPPRTVFSNPSLLAETNVMPPDITEIADAAGVGATILTIEDLFNLLSFGR